MNKNKETDMLRNNATFYEENKDRIILFDDSDSLVELRRDADCPNWIHPDTWIVRQQDRIDSLSDSLRSYIQDKFTYGSSFPNPFEGLSDDEMLELVKPRYIQTAAELKQYVLSLQYEKETKEALEKAEAALKAEAEKEVDKIDVNTTPVV